MRPGFFVCSGSGWAGGRDTENGPCLRKARAVFNGLVPGAAQGRTVWIVMYPSCGVTHWREATTEPEAETT